MVNVRNMSRSVKFSSRFGRLAVARGFVSEKQLHDALDEQISNAPHVRLRSRKRIGDIFFEKGWMTPPQIKLILNEILEDKQ